MKKNILTTAICSAAITSAIVAGPPITTQGGFATARHTISNPTLFDTALPQTQARLIYMQHNFPNKIRLAGGANLAMGGNLHLYALQVEYAFNDRFSLVAMKDGYVDFNPTNTFSHASGFANIAAGLKYAFILDHETQYALSGSAVIELPTGSHCIFQGKGDSSINLTLQNLKLYNNWQLAGALGLQLPFNNDFASSGFASFHASYEVTPWFIPMVELNYFRVFKSGDGGRRFTEQVGGAVPSVAAFEGADLLNWGAADSNGAEYATMALGFRSRLSRKCSIGFAYDFPLTDKQKNITADRYTFDLTYKF